MQATKVSPRKAVRKEQATKQQLFRGCFTVLVATAFGFVFRAFIMADWGLQFGLSKAQQTEIFGVGFWPFGISIVFFSLIIDKIGYKKSLIFAFTCHSLSALITLLANGYWMLYVSTFLFAVGNGAAEAVINPVVASLYPKEKTKWLNILHAGWPAGMVVGGMLGIFMIDQGFRWEIISGFFLVPTLIYGWMVLRSRFPVNERVKAGITYLEMLREVGILGALIIVGLSVFQLGALFHWSYTCSTVVTAALVSLFGYYVRTLGQPLLILLLLVMVPLAITELGTDNWISSLMAPEMHKMGLQGGWVLIYTSVIIALLRLYSGPLVQKLSPLGLLAVSALVAALGLVFLSYSTGFAIVVAATVYALGKTFFWPTMLGVVSEQYPRGGALALNFTGAVGMMGVGVIGAVILGFVQDQELDRNLETFDRKNNTQLHAAYISEEKEGLLGKYRSLDTDKLLTASIETQQIIDAVQNEARKNALRTVALFPVLMLCFYLGMLAYFKARGGYKPVLLLEEGSG